MHSDDFTMLDVAVFLAERWLILVFVPALAAIGVFLLAPEPPATYVATATMILPSPTTAENADSPPRWSRGFSLALSQVQEDVSATATNNRVEIRAERNSGADAEAAVLSTYFALSEPVVEMLSEEVARIENLLIAATAGISLPIKDTDSIETILAKAQVQSALFPLEEQAWKLKSAIIDLQSEPIVELSQRQAASLAVLTTLAGGAAFLVVLGFAVVQAAIKGTASDPAGKAKLARIRAALRLQKPPRNGQDNESAAV